MTATQLAARIRVGLSGYDDPRPCPSEGALRRHLAKTEACSRCGVDGAVPEQVWRGPAVDVIDGLVSWAKE